MKNVLLSCGTWAKNNRGEKKIMKPAVMSEIQLINPLAKNKTQL